MQYRSGECVVYIRVSTKEQEEKKTSPEYQIKHCIEYAENTNLKVKGIYKELGYSGSISERPGLNEALENIRKGDVFITLTVNRLSRNVAFGSELLNRFVKDGVYLHFVEDNIDIYDPTSCAMFHMNLTFAELQIKTNNKRIKSTLQDKKIKGEFMGRIPYGYKLSNGKKSSLEEDIQQQDILQMMRVLRNQLNMTYYEISNYLNEQGIDAPTKTKSLINKITGEKEKIKCIWRSQTVDRLINREDSQLILKGAK